MKKSLLALLTLAILTAQAHAQAPFITSLNGVTSSPQNAKPLGIEFGTKYQSIADKYGIKKSFNEYKSGNEFNLDATKKVSLDKVQIHFHHNAKIKSVDFIFNKEDASLVSVDVGFDKSMESKIKASLKRKYTFDTYENNYKQGSSEIDFYSFTKSIKLKYTLFNYPFNNIVVPKAGIHKFTNVYADDIKTQNTNYYKSGEVDFVTLYNDKGIRTKQTEYHKSGEVKYVVLYNDKGIKTQNTNYYKTGEVEYVVLFNDKGVLAKQTNYYKSGEIYYVTLYNAKGIKTKQTKYYKSGEVEYVLLYNDKGINTNQTNYYKTGEVEHVLLSNDKGISTKQTNYYKTGAIKGKYKYTNNKWIRQQLTNPSLPSTQQLHPEEEQSSGATSALRVLKKINPKKWFK